MSSEGQGNALYFLRFPSPALAASAHDQSDRIDLRDCPFANLSHQRPRVQNRNLDDGLQTHPRGPETLAPTTRIPTHPKSHHRRSLRRRRRINPTSRLTCYPFRMRLSLIHNI